MTWEDVCYKCGKKIFNGIPEGRDTHEFIEEMKGKGFLVGYKEKIAGGYGNTHMKACKPICSDCSGEDIRKRDDKIVNKELKKIIPTLKKVYVCPFCKGYSDQIFTSPNKKEVMDHMKDRHYTDLKNAGEY